jgi:hypothetical protein
VAPVLVEVAVGVTDKSNFGLALLSAAMTLPCVLPPALAETAPERGLLSFKYLDYQDSQTAPNGERLRRIHVRAPSVMAMVPLSSEWSVMGSMITDSISGASPAYHTKMLSKMHEFRRAGEASVTRYLPHGTVSVGLNYSGESDYVSRGASVLTTRSTDDKNTVWSAGVGLSRDQINPTNQIVTNESKQGLDLLLGVTQVMSPQDVAQLNLGFYNGQGYFSDPYKVYDQRPHHRSHHTMLGRWNHHFEATQSTTRLAYRYYTDNWGVRSHTLDVEWVQSLPQGWSVAPALRVYTQTAADFFVNADASPYPFPPLPPANALHYSEDQRVSAFGARTYGLKVTKQLGLDTRVDIKVERYAQRGDWALFGSGSTGLDPFYARVVQVGITHWFE